MSLSEIVEEFGTRQPLFTPQFSPNLGEELNPAARVWCGMTGDGPFERCLPILYHKEPAGPRKAIDYFKSFGNPDIENNRVKPFAYGSSRSGDSHRADVIYDVKPIKPGSIDVGNPSNPDLQQLASHWANERSDNSVDTDLKHMSDSVLRFYLDIRIYGQRFETFIPIFIGVPSATEVRRELKRMKIPCLALVDDNGEYENVSRPLETTVAPGVVDL